MLFLRKVGTSRINDIAYTDLCAHGLSNDREYEYEYDFK